MKHSFSERTWSSIAVGAMVLMLVGLAILQYRWSRDVSEAAGARMRASLQSSMLRFREDFSRELGNVAMALQSDSDAPIDSRRRAAELVQRIDLWKRNATHPKLLQNVYVLRREGDDLYLFRLNQQTAEFQPTEWPPEFGVLKEALQSTPDGPFFERHRFVRHVDNSAGQHGPDDEHGNAAGRRPENPARSVRTPRMPWFFDEGSSVMVQMQVIEPPPETPPTTAWILAELNQSVIEEQIFPQLAETNFTGAQGLDYDVAVINRGDKGNDRLIYSSNASLGPQTRPDGQVGLVGGPGGGGGVVIAMGGDAQRRPGAAEPRSEPWRFGLGQVRLERFRFADRGPGWQLIAIHRMGSLEAALASMHRRQLAMSFGGLLLLGVTMTMIIVATGRAQRLAKLQMDFVTGVSHELRTPLAVIASASENIADGIIDDKQRLARYGKVIHDSARRLTRLVEQILLFAATRHDNYQYSITRVQPSEIVKVALDHSAELIRESEFTLEQEVASDLPDVMVDLPAISQCLQNLISNAVKYGGDARWIGIRCVKADDGNGGSELQISVEDKGIGIAKSDLGRIFDPFYRSPAVASAQIQGTGVGLALAGGIAEAMNGQLTVESKIGQGSKFVLHLPWAKDDTTEGETAEQSNIEYEPERSNR